jgi:hypothetical protein
MTPEELTQRRAWLEQSDARRAGLSIDENIRVLEAEIAEAEAEEYSRR